MDYLKLGLEYWHVILFGILIFVLLMRFKETREYIVSLSKKRGWIGKSSFESVNLSKLRQKVEVKNFEWITKEIIDANIYGMLRDVKRQRESIRFEYGKKRRIVLDGIVSQRREILEDRLNRYHWFSMTKYSEDELFRYFGKIGEVLAERRNIMAGNGETPYFDSIHSEVFELAHAFHKILFSEKRYLKISEF